MDPINVNYDKNKPYLSIIVPVYNVIGYLDRCMVSLLNQNSEDYEIILVDDGSTDGSDQKCDYYAKEYSNVKSVHKTNGGLGSARNYGLNECHGNYVTFVDSDDWVSTNLVQFILNHTNADVDVLKYGFQRVKDEKYLDINIPYYDEGIYGRNGIENELLPGMIGPIRLFDYSKVPLVSACTCAYRIDFLNENNIRFKSERVILNEDTLFNYEVMLKAKKMKITHEVLYFYDFREGSLSKKKVANMLQRKQALLCAEKNLLVELDCWEKYKNSYYGAVVDGYYACITNECGRYSESKKESLQSIKKILCEEQCVEALKKCNHNNMSLKGLIIYWFMRIKAGNAMYFFYRRIKK